MPTKSKSHPEVLTFGCRLNIAESEIIRREAEEAGLHDVVIVNTCAVTAEAERQAGQAIRRLKREKPDVKIIVTGCSSQIDPQKYASMAEVAAVINNDQKTQPESYDKLAGHSSSISSPSRGGLGRGELRNISDSSHIPSLSAMQREFVEVQNGCDNACTFCIIPFGRGASRSVSFENVAKQVRAYVDQGFNEIVLTGVDIASYGRDLPGVPTLGFMTRHVLTHVPDLRRLRLSSLDPAGMDEDLWELIAEEPRLMPHLHLSVQSGDDMILKRMKRRHSNADVLSLVERARRLRPDIVFGADVIAGFPTETDAMFQNTYNLVKECGLTWLHVFQYSARKGTPAARMPQVHGSVRKERADLLRAYGEEASARYYKSLLGTTTSVLVENHGIGCTPQFAKLKLKGEAHIGDIVDARCVKMENDMVVAEVIKTL
ncbi:MAG: tRNA (N(6)-L-threonylcarbamoyladenosine(37)-C(2))-methylthiotransferase MtaB [Bdellovibrionales bacterium]